MAKVPSCGPLMVRNGVLNDFEHHWGRFCVSVGQFPPTDGAHMHLEHRFWPWEDHIIRSCAMLDDFEIFNFFVSRWTLFWWSKWAKIVIFVKDCHLKLSITSAYVHKKKKTVKTWLSHLQTLSKNAKTECFGACYRVNAPTQWKISKTGKSSQKQVILGLLEPTFVNKSETVKSPTPTQNQDNLKVAKNLWY